MELVHWSMKRMPFNTCNRPLESARDLRYDTGKMSQYSGTSSARLDRVEGIYRLEGLDILLHVLQGACHPSIEFGPLAMHRCIHRMVR